MAELFFNFIFWKFLGCNANRDGKQFLSLAKKSVLQGIRRLLLCSQQQATGTYFKAYKFIPRPQNLFPKIRFNLNIHWRVCVTFHNILLFIYLQMA